MLRACTGLVAAFLLLGGCTPLPPEFTNPVGPVGTTSYDIRLLGGWYWKPQAEQAHTYALQIAGAERDTLDIVATWTTLEADDGSVTEYQSWIRATAHATRVGGELYYSVRRENGVGSDYTADGEKPGYVILRAEIREDDSLVLHFMDSPFVIDRLVESGRLKGRQVECIKNCEMKLNFVQSMDGRTARYMLVDAQQGEIKFLIQSLPREVLFGDTFGPFRRYRAASRPVQ